MADLEQNVNYEPPTDDVAAQIQGSELTTVRERDEGGLLSLFNGGKTTILSLAAAGAIFLEEYIRQNPQIIQGIYETGKRLVEYFPHLK